MKAISLNKIIVLIIILGIQYVDATLGYSNPNDAVLRPQIFSDLRSAKTADDYKRILYQRLECRDTNQSTCDWEAHEILFSWLTDPNVEKYPQYDSGMLFQLIYRVVKSGTAEEMGVELNSIYSLGLFGVPRDGELSSCWTRVSLTTEDKTQVVDCEEVERRKYGRKSPWYYGFE